MSRGRLAIVALAILVVAGGVAAALLLRRPALAVGDCFDPPDTRGGLADVTAIPCAQPHRGELFLAAPYPGGGDYPGEAAFADFVSGQCVPAYTAYAGEDLMAADNVDIGWFFPTEEGWASGDRTVLCYATTVDGAAMTGSLRARE